MASEYGHHILFPVGRKLRKKIQRRATKLVPKFKNLSYEERLSKLKLPSLNYRRTRETFQ